MMRKRRLNDDLRWALGVLAACMLGAPIFSTEHWPWVGTQRPA